MIASGDHAFIPLAKTLRDEGLRVTVLADRHTCASELTQSAHRFEDVAPVRDRMTPVGGVEGWVARGETAQGAARRRCPGRRDGRARGGGLRRVLAVEAGGCPDRSILVECALGSSTSRASCASL